MNEEPRDLVRFVEQELGIELLPWQAEKLRQWQAGGGSA